MKIEKRTNLSEPDKGRPYDDNSNISNHPAPPHWTVKFVEKGVQEKPLSKHY